MKIPGQHVRNFILETKQIQDLDPTCSATWQALVESAGDDAGKTWTREEIW